jgi:putative chitinase
MDSLTAAIDAKLLTAIGGPVPSAKLAARDTNVTALAARLPAMMERFQINTKLRIEHFLAQIAHECDGFCTRTEYASGREYEGRTDLGNIRPGDGPLFKGRDPLQLTGRENYRKFTIWMHGIDPDAPDFEATPEEVISDKWFGWASIWYWHVHSINGAADRDSVIDVTRIINGGKNGLVDRETKLATAKRLVDAKAAFTPIAAAAISADQNGFAVLRRGMNDGNCAYPVTIEQLQRALSKAGYPVTIDGDFGPGTETAVKAFQKAHGLTVDGIVGRKTNDAIAAGA